MARNTPVTIDVVLAKINALETEVQELKRGLADTTDRRKRILRSLFDDTQMLQELELAFNKPGWKVEVDRILAKANGGERPHLNDDQLTGLRDLFGAAPFQLIDPVDNGRINIEALWFWRELLSLLPDEVERFHVAIVTWGAARTPETWAAVVECFDQIGLGDRWTEAHALALIPLNMDDIRFKSWKWFGSDGDLW